MAIDILRVALIVVVILRRLRRIQNRRRRNVWSRKWLQKREKLGLVRNLQQELRYEDVEGFRMFLRMLPNTFDAILLLIKPYIKKNDTFMRKSISPDERLSITLRFLATGESFRSLSFLYRVGERTISEIVKETTAVIVHCMKEQYLKTPTSKEEWKKIARGFQEKWNYPLCVGAIDGKHVAIRQPHNSGSQYFNYKHFFSLILLALVDADYRFIYVDVGAAGRCGDAGVFDKSTLKTGMDNNSLDFPEPENIPNTSRNENICHYHIIGDDAFPLRDDILKPYPHRNLTEDMKIFNYRLSRARRVVENAFGILANRFRVFLTTIPLEPEHVDNIILASCILHNYLITHQSSHYAPFSYLDHEDDHHMQLSGEWRQEQNDLVPLENTKRRNPKQTAKQQRDSLKNYFCNVGAVAWQNGMIA